MASPDEKFDPNNDLLIDFLQPVHALPETILQMYRTRDWDGIRNAEEVANADRKKLAEKVQSQDHGDDSDNDSDAWDSVDTGNADELKVCHLPDVGTMWRWTTQGDVAGFTYNVNQLMTVTNNPKMQAVVRLGMYSANTSSTLIIGMRFHTWKADIPYAVFKAAVSLVAAKFVVKSIVLPLSSAIEWLAARGVSLISRRTAGAIAGRFVIRSAGVILRLAVGALGPIAMLATWIGSDLALSYLMTTYNLRILVVNFQTEDTWKITSAGGYNETLGEGVEWKGAELPPLQLPGASIIPPGYIGEMKTKGVKLAYYAEYIYHNSSSFAGLTVTGAVGRKNGDSPVTEGFNYAYRVEKLANNSTGLSSGITDAQAYYQATSGKLEATKELQITAPVDVLAYSPEIWNAKDNKYELRIVIGKAPQ